MWNRLSERTGYFKGSVNQGIIFGESGAILVDTGLDRQAARKLIRLLAELAVEPVAIVNTHAHADHFGGNEELLAHYGQCVRVYAPVFEETAIRHPIWEPSYLYGGAYPLKELENKFLFAPPSPVHVVYDVGTLSIDGLELTVIPLYGHSHRQMGIGVDGVLFAADGFYGTEVLAKHPIPFHVDTVETLATLDSLSDQPYDIVVPGHGAAIHSFTERHDTMGQNKLVYERVLSSMLEVLREPQTIDVLQANISAPLGIAANNAGSFLLYRTAILALLKYLAEAGQIGQEITDNVWKWYAQP